MDVMDPSFSHPIPDFRTLVAVVNTVIEGIVTIDESGTIHWLNPAAVALFGYTVEELTGKNVNTLMPEPYHSKHDGYLQNYRLTNHPKIIGIDREVVGRRKDGSTFPLNLAVSEVRLEDAGGHRLFAGVVRDVTERKRAEESNAKLAAIVESSNDAIISKTLEGVVTTWNDGASRCFGYAANEMVGRSINVLVPPERLAEEATILQRLRRGERVNPFETVRVTKEGRHIDMLVTVSPIRNVAGEVIGASKIARDITALKSMESFKAAKEVAEAANRAKDEFLALISHDLRTPLNGILLWSTLLQKETLSEQQKEAVDAIQQCAKSQSGLIEDILDIARMIHGRLPVDMLPIRLADVIRSALEAVRPMAEDTGIGMTAPLTGDSGAGQFEPMVLGDANRLQQVFTNLLTNALKFTPRGGRVTISMGSDDSGVWTKVIDTGKGITLKFLPHIFERLSQVRGSSAGRHAGLGLGLSIVKAIVESHGGSVRAESEGLGLGATFTVTLALIKDQTALESPAV